ncbi:MAG TPA: DEAD/DEAH box helicase [Gemmatimonadales bacterium]|nr:DEAD/DEAH box helicase [Gemmatimonadales bacterium]
MAGTELQPGDAGEIARAIAASLRSSRSDADLPDWLREDQCQGVRRTLNAISRYGGALLADPTGSGKTYSALAVGSLWEGRGGLVVLAPAALLQQWRRTAEELHISIEVHSHERVSRGALPTGRPRLVIVDESHWFRNPNSRRYRTLAPYLIGRKALLLSATPIVNRLIDLAHQLLLAVRDDCLAWHGLTSLTTVLRGQTSHPALGELVITRSDEVSGRPCLTRRTAFDGESDRPPVIMAGLDRLALSTKPGTASILRNTLYRAMESSPAALLGVLRRYQALLRHAADARAVGRPLDRAALRRFTAGADEQLVLWALLPKAEEQGELVLEDGAGLDCLIKESARWAETDTKPGRLADMLRDSKVTLVFTCYRETVTYLRRRLASRGPAWCTGDRSGIGPSLMERDDVLAWFSPSRRPRGPGPQVLLTTDVSAEGLDLQLAERVIHYDLPWTDVGLAQRDGRAARLGSRHTEVESIRYQPTTEGEERLHGHEILARKARMPQQAGLGEGGRWLFRWREELLDLLPSGAARSGVAVIDSPEEGILVGFELRARGKSDCPRVSTAGWLIGGEWSEAPEQVELRLIHAAGSRNRSASAQEITLALRALQPMITFRSRGGNSTRWAASNPSPGQAQLLQRLRQLIETAVQARDLRSLDALEEAVRFTVRGHTAGEAELILKMSTMDDASLKRSLASIPKGITDWHSMVTRITGILIFADPSLPLVGSRAIFTPVVTSSLQTSGAFRAPASP